MSNEALGGAWSAANTFGALPASWGMPGAQWDGPNPQNLPMFSMGDSTGVPGIAGPQSSLFSGSQTATMGSVNNALAYGQSVTARHPLNKPILWLFGAVALGLAGLATIAHGHISAD